MTPASASTRGRSRRRSVSIGRPARRPEGSSPEGGSAGSAGSAEAASAPIVGIDVDIAVGQIAGPDPRPTLAHADVDRDRDLLPLHMGGNRGLVIIGDALAASRDLDPADGDLQLVAIGLLARLAHRHDDAAPIGVLAGDGGL